MDAPAGIYVQHHHRSLFQCTGHKTPSSNKKEFLSKRKFNNRKITMKIASTTV